MFRICSETSIGNADVHAQVEVEVVQDKCACVCFKQLSLSNYPTNEIQIIQRKTMLLSYSTQKVLHPK